jgi:hypothetical protein
MKIKEQLIYSRDYIEKNVIFKILYPINSRSRETKLKSIIPLFEKFLILYSAKLKKYSKNFPKLSVETFNIEKNSRNENKFHIFIYTKPFNNHPFLVYGNTKLNYFNILLPFGDKIGQTNLIFYENILHLFTDEELEMLIILVNKTINVRYYNLIYTKEYSLLNCENIKICRNYMNKINKLGYGNEKKKKIIDEISVPYKIKAKIIISEYFKYLENYDFKKAYLFIGKGNIINSEFHNKPRIDNFFIKSKKIYGHLEILILLYKLREKIEFKLKKI